MATATDPSPPREALRSNIRSNLVGLAAYAAGQWLQLVIVARIGGPAGAGSYAFALAVSAPAVTFASLHLRMLQASDARRVYPFTAYLRLRTVTTAAAMAAIALAAAATRGAVDWAVLVPVCAMRAADALADVHYGLWQQHERMRVIGTGLAINAASSVAFMLAAAALGGGIAGAAAGSALGSATALAYVRLRTTSDGALRPLAGREAAPAAWATVWRLARQAAPLGVILLLASLSSTVPQYFVRHFGGEAVLGVFAAAVQLTATGNVVVGALGQAASPRLAAAWVLGDLRAYRGLAGRLAGGALGLGAAGVALSAVAGAEVLRLLYGEPFASGQPILVVLSVAAAASFVTTLLGDALTSARIIAFQPVMLAASVGLLAACCALLVPRFGGMGAAVSLAIAYAIQALASAVVLRWFAAPAPRPALG